MVEVFSTVHIRELSAPHVSHNFSMNCSYFGCSTTDVSYCLVMVNIMSLLYW